MRTLTAAILIVIGLAAFSTAGASIKELDPAMRSRPEPEAGPTVVNIECYVIDIMKINDHEQTFDADLSVRMQWHDPRLARPGKNDVLTLPLIDIWNPRLRIANQREIKEHFPDIVRVDADGTVSFEQRYSGDFTTTADIREFPFDERILKIVFVTADLSASEIELEYTDGRIGRMEEFSIPNWTIGDVIPRTSTFSPFGNETLLRLDLEMQADRRSSYYIWSAIVPLLLIVMMSWSVFLVKPHHLGAQLTMAATSMLTLIAYRFAISSVLPPIPYMTKLDIFITGSTIIVFLSLAESVITGSLADNDHNKLAEKIDTLARALFPPLYAVFVVLTFLFI